MELESMQTRPTVTLPALRAPSSSNSRMSPLSIIMHVSNRAVHRARHFGVQLELAILAVNRNEILRLDQVDDELQLFLAGMSADVYRRRRTVVVDDVRIAAEEVIDHAIDRLLVAGNMRDESTTVSPG